MLLLHYTLECHRYIFQWFYYKSKARSHRSSPEDMFVVPCLWSQSFRFSISLTQFGKMKGHCAIIPKLTLENTVQDKLSCLVLPLKEFNSNLRIIPVYYNMDLAEIWECCGTGKENPRQDKDHNEVIG